MLESSAGGHLALEPWAVKYLFILMSDFFTEHTLCEEDLTTPLRRGPGSEVWDTLLYNNSVN